MRCLDEMCSLYEVRRGGDVRHVGGAWWRCMACMRCVEEMCGLYEVRVGDVRSV